MIYIFKVNKLIIYLNYIYIFQIINFFYFLSLSCIHMSIVKPQSWYWSRGAWLKMNILYRKWDWDLCDLNCRNNTWQSTAEGENKKQKKKKK